MLPALIINVFSLLIQATVRCFQREASPGCLAICSVSLTTIAALFIIAGLQSRSSNNYMVIGIALIAVVVLLILLNTVFREKDMPGEQS